MPLWPLLTFLLLLFSSPSCSHAEEIVIPQLSFEAQQPFLRGLQSQDNWVYATMCVGSNPDLVRRCLISAARWRYVTEKDERDIPLIYYVHDVPQKAIDYLHTLRNVFVVELQEMEWIPSERYPNKPKRFYSFYKFAAFNLFGFRVLWFDSDAYLVQNPSFLFDWFPSNATGGEIVAWNAKGRRGSVRGFYFNSGLCVFEPIQEMTQLIYEIWSTGTFRMHFKVFQGNLDNLTEQEVLLTAYSTKSKLIPIPHCINYRSHEKYSKPNRHCNISQVVAFHDAEAFDTDVANFCFYWKKSMLMGSDPLLCDVDKLAEGAPWISLDDCSLFFIPPRQTTICDPNSPHSPSFRPDVDETNAHFATHEKHMLALQALSEKIGNQLLTLNHAKYKGFGLE